MKTITIVSPCYNEQLNVRACHEEVRALFDGPLKGYRREHIFADNCSKDDTPAMLREIAAGDPDVKVILNSRNFGPFRSNFNALRYATGDAVVVFLPVDLQDPPQVIADMVRRWEDGVEVVCGARINRQESWALRTSRGIFYRIVNGLSDIDIPLNVGEFQLLDRKVWQALMQFDDHYPYIRGMIASLGFRREVLPYTWKARRAGISTQNLPRMVDQALNGIFSFTIVPMRLCTLTGFFLAFLCMIYVVVAVTVYAINPNLVPRGITTLIVSIFFLSSVQLVFIGMLGEYVTSIHSQVRRGGKVIERERINIDRPALGQG